MINKKKEKKEKNTKKRKKGYRRDCGRKMMKRKT